jgi:tRNA A-37 threonylcarbamoyl transferase component Bud32
MSEKWKKIIHEVFGNETKLVFPRYFDSKKNQVTLLQMQLKDEAINVVAKYFVWGDIDKEWDTLRRAYSLGLNVPCPLHRHENISFMNFIPGKTLKVIAEKEPEKINPKIIGNWLGKFHRAFMKNNGETLLKGDNMLPNFIVHLDKEMLFGVDFEESHYGNPIDEISDIYATLLITSISGQKLNIEAAEEFFDAYTLENHVNIDKQKFQELIISHIDKRKKYMPYRYDEFEHYISQVKQQCF